MFFVHYFIGPLVTNQTTVPGMVLNVDLVLRLCQYLSNGLYYLLRGM